ncbi:MAG: hypothetical protein JW990_15910 [Thermoleophilia bacterium]|nr:hypothetical protein [Thermoleophilia bacterium]
MSEENVKWLLEVLRDEMARHDRFRRDVLTVLAAIIRSQGGTLRVSRAALAGGRPDQYITMTNDLETGDVVYRLQTLPLKEAGR